MFTNKRCCWQKGDTRMGNQIGHTDIPMERTFCFASGHQRDFVQATANVELLQVFL